ncbi:MAG: tyrosine-type recombinase/integrase [Cyclobacteriaceae bacterium]
MEKFRKFMTKQGYGKRSITSYIECINIFLQWMEIELLEISKISYDDLLLYVDHLQKKGVAKGTSNMYLIAVQHYMRSLGMDITAIGKLRVRNTGSRIRIANILPHADLVSLYGSFPTRTKYQKRYKVILGLIVFQALNTRDITTIKVSGIDIDKGQIRIPSTRTSTNRTLELNSKQVLSLHEFIEIRTEFVKSQSDSYDLFLTGAKRFQSVYGQLVGCLKKMDDSIQSCQQIRASTIHHWLHLYSLREVQHMCGHKYVSSTEAYLDSELEELEDDLGSYHPLSN